MTTSGGTVCTVKLQDFIMCTVELDLAVSEPAPVNRRSQMAGDDDNDPILPMEIHHEVDRIVIDGKLEQEYNYWIYVFKKYGAFVKARSYRDDIGVVSIFGPFADEACQKQIEAPELYAEVLSYLKRRFMAIDRLDEEGYITVWTRPSDGLYDVNQE